jgi:hypothetical protein
VFSFQSTGETGLFRQYNAPLSGVKSPVSGERLQSRK